MSLNPVHFGKEVVDQYARHLLTTFSFADDELMGQLRQGLGHAPGREERLAKGPYVYLNRPFVQGPGMNELVSELGLHSVMSDVFPYESLHKHQERCIRAAVSGRNVLLATGTGSGKTEAFLLPIIQHCLEMRDSHATSGVTALIIYPMNALVNDQLGRMRRLLAGTRITFGRYTGETSENVSSVAQLGEPRRYTAEEIRRAEENREELPLPWEECFTREEIRRRKPRILLTNYSQLEFLLLRDKDLELFRGAPIQYFVLDEVHTYSGSLGSEVACLLRRMRAVCKKSAEDITCIGTSATVTDREGGDDVERSTLTFARELFGVPEGSIDLIREEYRDPDFCREGGYTPPAPGDPLGLLETILDSVRETILEANPTDVSGRILELASELCGKTAPAEEDSLDALYSMLEKNRLVSVLYDVFTEPRPFSEAVDVIRELEGHEGLSDSAVEAEMLCYLVLGALARREDEPLLRPKLHYFVQGLHGVWLSFERRGAGLARRLHFSEEAGGDSYNIPVIQCRACGQHYFLAAAGERIAVQEGQTSTWVRDTRYLEGVREDPEEGEEVLLLTDTLHGQDEIEAPQGEPIHLCRHCGSLHGDHLQACLGERCRKSEELVELRSWPLDSINRCPSCNTVVTRRGRVLMPLRSGEANDVMVIAQTMLSAMREEELRKVLIFADSRQEAAFQAGWMEKRALRFRVRHLIHSILKEHSGEPLYFDSLHAELVQKGIDEGMLPSRGRRLKEWEKRLNWMMVEEFFNIAPGARRSGLEQLGLARIEYEDIRPGGMGEFGEKWASELGVGEDGLADLVSLVLDRFRLYHAVSHEMLSKCWSDRDREVRKGIVSIQEYYRPMVILRRTSPEEHLRSYSKGFMAPNGASAVQVMMKQGLPRLDSDTRDEFLEGLWNWLVEQDYLVTASITRRRGRSVKRIRGLPGARQVNLDLMKIGYSEERYVCQKCHKARGYQLPNGACPQYRCDGHTELAMVDSENYDVYQYRRMEFAPLNPREHSAQVPKAERAEIEGEFKKTEGRVNCIVATPTLELGVDIGKLEMVLMRNVPPSPANYAQRGGRAGRKHRIGAVFTYCRNRRHDHYFYSDPPEMIAGSVKIPSFSMQNSPLVRKHVNSMILTELRRLCGDDQSVLDDAFPTFIREYFGFEDEGGEQVVRQKKKDFTALADLVREHRSTLLESLERTFLHSWPREYSNVVSKPALRRMLGDFAGDLEEIAATLLAEVNAYRKIRSEIQEKEQSGRRLTPQDQKKMENYRRAENKLWSNDQENYTLSYLARKGFLPGYALVRESVTATCMEPLLNLTRNVAQALREFTPANLVYANGNEFKVNRLAFHKMQALDPDFKGSSLIKEMMYESGHGLLVEKGSRKALGGDLDWHPVDSLRLIDVNMGDAKEISDQKDRRFFVGFDQKIIALRDHDGGHTGNLGPTDYHFLRHEKLRLVNLGPNRRGDAVPAGQPYNGFPICPVCGAVRSPFASEAEIANFAEQHQKLCSSEIGWFALHAEIASDVLVLGPFEEHDVAVNLIESALLGAEHVLELNERELSYSVWEDENGLQSGVIYDPVPGGSGFLDLLINYWEDVVDAASGILSSCDCETACYRCLLGYANQRYHEQLNRHFAVDILKSHRGGFSRASDIPPAAPRDEGEMEGQDSNKEEEFLEILEDRGFPLPEDAQHRIGLGGSSYTIADFAYPSRKIAIYIDGLSREYHGDTDTQVRDRRKRLLLKGKGWTVLSISATGLEDEAVLSGFLSKLSANMED